MGGCIGVPGVDDEGLVNDEKIVRVMSESDEKFLQAVDVAARSFCGTTRTAPEGMLGWAYGGTSADGAPLGSGPSEVRLKWFRWLLTWSFTKAIRGGGAIYVLLADDDRVVAATVIYPPSTAKSYETTRCQFMSLVFAVGGPPTSEEAGAMDRLGAVEEVTHRLHEIHAPGPHIFVNIVAVDPDQQGHGFGGMFLGFLGKLADKLEVPMYLETTGDRNRAFYTNKANFNLAGALPVTLPGGHDPSNHAGDCLGMLRQPSSARV